MHVLDSVLSYITEARERCRSIHSVSSAVPTLWIDPALSLTAIFMCLQMKYK
jgi:hypothetical protein